MPKNLYFDEQTFIYELGAEETGRDVRKKGLWILKHSGEISVVVRQL